MPNTLGQRVAGLESDVRNLTAWQHSQNNALKDVRTMVQGLQKQMTQALGTAVLAIIGIAVNIALQFGKG